MPLGGRRRLAAPLRRPRQRQAGRRWLLPLRRRRQQRTGRWWVLPRRRRRRRRGARARRLGRHLGRASLLRCAGMRQVAAVVGAAAARSGGAAVKIFVECGGRSRERAARAALIGRTRGAFLPLLSECAGGDVKAAEPHPLDRVVLAVVLVGGVRRADGTIATVAHERGGGRGGGRGVLPCHATVAPARGRCQRGGHRRGVNRQPDGAPPRWRTQLGVGVRLHDANADGVVRWRVRTMLV